LISFFKPGRKKSSSNSSRSRRRSRDSQERLYLGDWSSIDCWKKRRGTRNEQRLKEMEMRNEMNSQWKMNIMKRISVEVWSPQLNPDEMRWVKEGLSDLFNVELNRLLEWIQ
jgi:hypothetical protein